MNISKTVKGIALGSSLAAFATLAIPSTSQANELLGNQKAKQMADKKKDDKKKKNDKKDGEKSCGGEKGCGGDKGGEK